MERRGVEGSVAQRQGSRHVRYGGVNGWRGKGRDEPTAPEEDSEGDFRELERDRHEIKEKCKCKRVLE